MTNQSTDPAGLDKLSPEQMAAWLRETAKNTRRYSNPTWCDAYKKPYDPLAAHVAFRMEQAAELFDAFNRFYEWIEQWSRAYPLDIFPEPNMKRAHEALNAAGLTLDAVSASSMRHVITLVRDELKKAMTP